MRSLRTPTGSIAAAPERAVLLRVIECDANGSGPARLSGSLREVRDGEALVDAARRHGLLALLHHTLRERCPDDVPEALRQRLRRLFLRNAERNLRISAQLLAVIERFEEAGVRVVPFKGPVLAEAVYGDVGMRQYADLDVLVARSDVRRAGELLASLGFGLAHGSRRIDDALLQTAECHAGFHELRSQTTIEVHWRTGPRFANASLPAEDLIAAALRTTLMGRPVDGLSPRDTYLVVCVHAAHHRWDQLEHVVTVGRLIRGGTIVDWRGLLDRAAAYGCRRRCLIGAALARRLTGVSLPAELDSAVDEDPVAVELAHEAEQHLFDVRVPAPSGGVRALVWQSRALDSHAAAVRHLVDRAITPGVRDWEWLELPPGLGGLYYAVRPVRMAVQYARRGPQS